MCLFPEGWILEGKCHLDAEDKNQLRKMAFDTRGISAIPPFLYEKVEGEIWKFPH